MTNDLFGIISQAWIQDSVVQDQDQDQDPDRQDKDSDAHDQDKDQRKIREEYRVFIANWAQNATLSAQYVGSSDGGGAKWKWGCGDRPTICLIFLLTFKMTSRDQG